MRRGSRYRVVVVRTAGSGLHGLRGARGPRHRRPASAPRATHSHHLHTHAASAPTKACAPLLCTPSAHPLHPDGLHPLRTLHHLQPPAPTLQPLHPLHPTRPLHYIYLCTRTQLVEARRAGDDARIATLLGAASTAMASPARGGAGGPTNSLTLARSKPMGSTHMHTASQRFNR